MTTRETHAARIAGTLGFGSELDAEGRLRITHRSLANYETRLVARFLPSGETDYEDPLHIEREVDELKKRLAARLAR